MPRFNNRSKCLMWFMGGVFSVLSIVLPANAQDTEVLWVAGTQPDQRPAQAPRITEVNKTAAWYEQALTGIHPPYPASFRFLEDQGNWHTPFNQPGMLAPYDLRGWHTER